FNANGSCSSTDTDTPATADLKISKTDNTTSYTAGGTTTYTIVVTNAGPQAANNAVVTDTRPTPIATWAWACTGATGGALGCDPMANSASNFSDTVSLPAGSSITYTVTSM